MKLLFSDLGEVSVFAIIFIFICSYFYKILLAFAI